LRNRNVAVVRLRIDEIERIPPKPDIELMIAACGLALAAMRGGICSNRRRCGTGGKSVARGNFGYSGFRHSARLNRWNG
jgi:hypothetical protein